MKQNRNKIIKKKESFLDIRKEASLPKKDIFELAEERKDKNGLVDMSEVYDIHPEVKPTFIKKLRFKQEMIVDSITGQDLTSATLRDKAVSSKALGEQAMDLEQGKPMGNIQVFYIKAK